MGLGKPSRGAHATADRWELAQYIRHNIRLGEVGEEAYPGEHHHPRARGLHDRRVPPEGVDQGSREPKTRTM